MALALLADHFGGDHRAVELHHDFKWAVVAKLPKRGWTLTSRQIEQALSALKSSLIAGAVGS